MVIRDSLLDFPLHPLLPFMVTMATLAHSDYTHPAIRGFIVTMAHSDYVRPTIRGFMVTMAAPTGGNGS
jgi:hypothetical protein